MLAIALGLLLSCNAAQAQRHFFKRIEFGSENVWTFTATEILSVLINQCWFNYPLTEGTIRFSVPYTDNGNLNTFAGIKDFNNDDDDSSGNYDFVNVKPKNLFSHLLGGVKLGYLTDYPGSFNWCCYGAAYYNLHQLKLMDGSDSYTRLNTQRAQVGGGVMAIIGGIEKDYRWIIDVGLRYNIPTYFHGNDIEGGCKDIMGKGLTSHYMLKVSLNNSVAVGFAFDVMHYNLFKDESLCGDSSKIFQFGISAMFCFDAI